MHELIASPFMGEHLVLHPGSPNGLKIPHDKYPQLEQIAASGGVCPFTGCNAGHTFFHVDPHHGRFKIDCFGFRAGLGCWGVRTDIPVW